MQFHDLITMRTLVKYTETASNWKARVKTAKDRVMRAEHEHDKATRREAKLKEQITS